MGNVERPPRGGRALERCQARLHQVIDVLELHQTVAVAGDDHRPVEPDAVPEKRLAIKGVFRTIDERRPQGNSREARFVDHAEKRPLAPRFVPNVVVRMAVGSERVILGMVQALAVSRHARHEDVTRKISGNGLGSGCDLLRSGAPLPVVGDVKDSVKPLARRRPANSDRVVSIRYQVAHAMAKRMLRLAVKNRDLLAGFEKSPGEVLPNKQRSTDYKNAHGWFASQI